MEFTLAGKTYNIAPKEVERKMQGVVPERVLIYAVKLNGNLFPVKQVIAHLTGLSKADFTSHQAHSILRRMGLEVVNNERQRASYK